MINPESDELDEPRPHQSLLTRLKKFVGHDDFIEEEDEEEEEEVPAASAARSGGSLFSANRRAASTLRLDHVRRTHITVRRSVQGFDDARRAADGLKEGQQQIVNLEQTPAEMAERIIDFLNGATYAIDGSVERIGDQVYLFTPSTVTIDIDDRSAQTPRSTFLDRV